MESINIIANKMQNYDLHIDRKIFSQNNNLIQHVTNQRPVFMVIDKRVYQIYSDEIKKYALNKLQSVHTLVLDLSERNKDVDQVLYICKTALENNLPRNGIFIAIGGGVLLDVCGLAASIYRRGVDLIRIPTTLLGIIDVGVGVKHGVNFAGEKNFLGSFYPSLAVISDIGVLSTLEEQNIAEGLAEIIKISIVGSSSLFKLIEDNAHILVTKKFQKPENVTLDIIVESIQLMANELEPNMYEDDLKRPADFGHTFSPAIEMKSSHLFSHGEAVGLDMLLSTAIAIDKGLCGEPLLPRLIKLYNTIGLPTNLSSISPQCLFDSLHRITNHRGGNLNLFVPREIGDVIPLAEVSLQEIRYAMNSINNFRKTVQNSSTIL